jgi:hypothetical protein
MCGSQQLRHLQPRLVVRLLPSRVPSFQPLDPKYRSRQATPSTLLQIFPRQQYSLRRE